MDSLQEQTYPLLGAYPGGCGARETVSEKRPKPGLMRESATSGWPRMMELPEIPNAAIELAQGAYIGLLDHDDILTPGRSLRNGLRLGKTGTKRNTSRIFVLRWRVKCDGGKRRIPTSPTEKRTLTWICCCLIIISVISSVMDAAVMKRLRLRTGFDGAQDYDLVLRAAGQVL